MMLVLTAAVCVVATSLYSRADLQKRLSVLNTAFAVNEIIEKKFTQSFKPVATEDLVQAHSFGSIYLYNLYIFKGPEVEQRLRELSPENKKKYELVKKVVQEKKSLPNSYYTDKQYFFANPANPCAVFIFKGGFDKKQAFFDLHAGSLFVGKKADGYLMNFSTECFNSPREARTVLIIRAQCPEWIECKERWFIGFSKRDMNRVYTTEFLGEDLINKKSFDKKSFLVEYSDADLHFIQSEDYYYYFPIEFYQRALFQLATLKKNKLYKSDQFEVALQDVFNLGYEEADFAGIKLEAVTFFRLAPVAFLILLYELYRRMRVISRAFRKATEPWLLLRVDSRFDYALSYIVCLTPLLSFLLIIGLYLDTQNLALPILGYEVSLRGILTFTVPKAMGSGRYALDIWSSVLAFGVIPVCYLLYRLQKDMFAVLNNSNLIWRKKVF